MLATFFFVALCSFKVIRTDSQYGERDNKYRIIVYNDQQLNVG